MILNGFDSQTSQLVETAEVNSSFKTCHNMSDFPIITRGTFGALLPGNNTPIVCGGFIDNSSSNKCFLYKASGWTETMPMIAKRVHLTGMAKSPYQNDSHKMFVLGGSTPIAEVLTDSGWETIGPETPSQFYLSCLVVINVTSILVIGGQTPTKEFSNETFIFNSLTNKWTTGPRLINGRIAFGCGYIKKTENINTKFFIAAGGIATQTVELLRSVSDIWISGFIFTFTFCILLF